MIAKRTGGFTLLEVLVVIALTGLISVLVLQMLTVLFRGYDQIGRIQSEVSLESMRSSWFRSSVSLMMASLDEEFAFKGENKRLSGFTTAPLMGPKGKIAKVSWEVRQDQAGVSLWYREFGYEPMRIGKWTTSNLTFAYRGLQSGWLDTWPPSDLQQGVLPHRVKLSISSSEDSREIYAGINVRRTGRYDYRDLL